MVQGIEQTYEGMFLVNAATAAEDWAGVIATIERIMERSEAVITKIDKWDERRLCYSIAGQKRGTYILCYFKSNPDAIGKIERDVQLSETVLRVLILRADRIPQLIQDIPTPFVQVQRQKQQAAAKVAAESESSAEAVSEFDKPACSSDDEGKSKDIVEESNSLDEEIEGDIPDIMDTLDDKDKDKGVLEEKPQAGGIDEPESLSS
ncbi:MAG: 30S ribosomal protein S6 [Planctomycetes bacterium]|nr:30S ribosomal protein S6 [Planctomycetota bacterium]